MKKILLMVTGALILFGLSACDKEPSSVDDLGNKPMNVVDKPIEGRWFTTGQVARGNLLFQDNCAVCHKADASGTKQWKVADANGKYPPPPLNGTAHAWHHSLSILRRSIKKGGVDLGGTMPGFGDKFTDKEILMMIAWIQSHWSDEIYGAWSEQNAPKKQSLQ